MKIVILNGLARKGNTYACINAFVEGAKAGNEIANNPEALAEMKTVGGKYAF